MSDLFDWLSTVSNDPYAFTMGAYPWGKGVLSKYSGPMPWAQKLMNDIKLGLVDLSVAIQHATASGHGIGKSATVAQLILWAFCTFPDTRGVVTANTEHQLRTKTWAELGKWFNLSFFGRDHFNLTATALTSKDPERERTWRMDAIPWSEKNAQAFSGEHNLGKRLIMIFDEASEIHDLIWETAQGAFTDIDTQLIWLVFGNPTRATGRFRDCFPGGRFNKYWRCEQIDSRTVPITNKEYISRLIEAYGGEDNDIIRYRVLGQFPVAGLMEFFSPTAIEDAMSRLPFPEHNAPLALGVDVARFGANSSVIFPRRGRDARTWPRRRFQGISTTELTDHIVNTQTQLAADGIMVDGGGVGGGVIDNLRHQQLHCYEVQFGGRDIVFNSVWGNTGEHYANNRAAMYGNCRSWLKTGCLPDDPALRQQMLSIRYTFNKKDEILLERKEDLVDENGYGISVDDIDALCLTFAHPLTQRPFFLAAAEIMTEWDPYAADRMWGT